MCHSTNSACCTEDLLWVRYLFILGKDGSLSLRHRISNFERHPCSGEESPGMQSSCNSGRAPIRPILMVILTEWSSWLLVNSMDEIDVSVSAMVPCSVLWLTCSFGFPNHSFQYFSRHLHSPVHKLGAFHLTSSPQEHEPSCSLISPNQSMARSQVYLSQTFITHSYSIYHDGTSDSLNKWKINI